MRRVVLAMQGRSAQEPVRHTDLQIRGQSRPISSRGSITLQRRHAIIGREVKIGLRFVAAPVAGASGMVAAVSSATQAARVSTAEMRWDDPSALKRAATEPGATAPR